MTDVTFTINGPTVGTVSHQFQLPNDGDGTRLLEWAKHPDVYGYPVEVDEETTREPTDDEVIARVWSAIIKGTFANVVRHEKRMQQEALEDPQEPDVVQV